MQINERGDIVISQEDNAISLINELLLTLPDGYIDAIEILLNELSIKQQKKFAIEIEKKQLLELSSRAWGVYWKSNYEASVKKSLCSPYKLTTQVLIKQDQEKINQETQIKFQQLQQEKEHTL
jgi:di/tripeptidase